MADHRPLLNIQLHTGFWKHAVSRFANYLPKRTQCVCVAGSTYSFLDVVKAVHQGLVLGPILFSIDFTALCFNLSNASNHFMLMASLFIVAHPHLFKLLHFYRTLWIQSHLQHLKLGLNNTTKLMVFSKIVQPRSIPPVLTLRGKHIELISNFKQLRFILDCELSLKAHIALANKLKRKLSFYIWNHSCFSLRVRNTLVAVIFMLLLDCGHVCTWMPRPNICSM